MTTDEEMTLIGQRLLQATKQKRLVWTKFDLGDGEYTASSTKFTYYLRPRDNDGAAPFIFQVYASDVRGEGGLITEYVTTKDAGAATTFAELFEAIRLSMFGIDSLKDAILGDFDDLA